MGGRESTTFWGASEGGNLPGSPLNESSEDELSFVVLSLATETFAVEIHKVREIIRVPKITWVPGTPDFVRGIINLRGNVVSAIDLAAVLSLPPWSESPQSRIIIVDTEQFAVGLIVDSASRVVEIAPSLLQPALRTLDENQRTFVIAQANMEDALVGILDIDQVMDKVRPTTTAS